MPLPLLLFRLTPLELQQLAASIRIPSLGPCYLSYVCLQQEWFASTVDLASLARAAAFAAAGPEVRKDLAEYTASSTAAAMQLAAAALSRAGGGCSGSSASGSNEASSFGRNNAMCALSFPGTTHRCSLSGSEEHSQVLAAAAHGACGSDGCAGGGSTALEHKMQLLSLSQAMQRPRAVSNK